MVAEFVCLSADNSGQREFNGQAVKQCYEGSNKYTKISSFMPPFFG